MTYKIPLCSYRLDSSWQATYYIDGKEVTKEEYDKMRQLEEAEVKEVNKPQNSKKYKMPANYGDKHDWSRERDPDTGKDGRYIPQLARYPGDPKAVCRHAKDVAERGKKLGMNVEWHTT